MGENSLVAEPRTAGGKGFARRIRLQGRVPGVFYYHGESGVPFSVNEMNLIKLLKNRPSLLELNIEGEEPRECVIRELQRDPVDDHIVHIDLMGIKRGQKLTVTVPVQLIGIPEGVKNDGGVLQHGLNELTVECFPRDIPESVEVNVEDLVIGQSRLLQDLDVPTLKFLDDPKNLIATVQPPTVVKEPVVEVEEELEEVEGEAVEGEEEAETKAEDEKPKDE